MVKKQVVKIHATNFVFDTAAMQSWKWYSNVICLYQQRSKLCKLFEIWKQILGFGEAKQYPMLGRNKEKRRTTSSKVDRLDSYNSKGYTMGRPEIPHQGQIFTEKICVVYVVDHSLMAHNQTINQMVPISIYYLISIASLVAC